MTFSFPLSYIFFPEITNSFLQDFNNINQIFLNKKLLQKYEFHRLNIKNINYLFGLKFEKGAPKNCSL